MTRSLLRSLAVSSLSMAVLSACVADSVDRSSEPLSEAGPWDIPADTAAIGDTMHVPYTGAGPWVGESGCGGSLSPGARELRSWILGAFPQVTSVGGYSCRAIVGDSTTMSVHATGRALDIMLPLHAGDADNDLGDPIGEWFIEHAEEIGIQYIIWDRWTWSGSRAAGSKERMYGGTHPHHDHLHVELSVDGGAMRTPWFSGPRALPEVDCPALPDAGGVVEETSECFRAFGPSQYWRSVSAGHGGSMLWTNAFESTTPSNWARWHVTPSVEADYTVSIYAEPMYSVHRATRYTVRHAGVDHDVVVDLSGASGWVELGVFHFDGGGGEHVSVYDNSVTAVASDQHIPADALRLTPVAPSPEPTPEPTPEPIPGPQTISIATTVSLEAGPIVGGDPTIDDDAYGPGRETITGGCSASGRGADERLGGLALVACALLLVVRRRR